MTHALELKDLRKSFGKTEIIRGVSLAVNAGERIAVIGPNGAAVHAVQPDQRALRAHQREVLLTASESTAKTVRDQPDRTVAQFPDHQHLPEAFGLQNLRSGVWSLGYSTLPEFPAAWRTRTSARSS